MEKVITIACPLCGTPMRKMVVVGPYTESTRFTCGRMGCGGEFFVEFASGATASTCDYIVENSEKEDNEG